MNQIEFKRRTKQFGLAVIRMTEKFPETRLAWVVKDQILRSALSVGANYRAVCRAKSDKDFINKMRIVEEEADETAYWLEIIEESELLKADELSVLKKEINELVAMIVASIRTKSISLNKERESQNH
ncbi:MULTISPECIES: four helix bundle protein [Butyricimonas]|uniref:four helix bundle protein n=1 Tax=Butyricimonas TaxID=574697 RepID=UPI00035D2E18|nr:MULTISPECIES: four helix bundle protein [Butyricimonas]